jgi:hypothetical protein
MQRRQVQCAVRHGRPLCDSVERQRAHAGVSRAMLCPVVRAARVKTRGASCTGEDSEARARRRSRRYRHAGRRQSRVRFHFSRFFRTRRRKPRGRVTALAHWPVSRASTARSSTPNRTPRLARRPSHRQVSRHYRACRRDANPRQIRGRGVSAAGAVPFRPRNGRCRAHCRFHAHGFRAHLYSCLRPPGNATRWLGWALGVRRANRGARSPRSRNGRCRAPGFART